MQAYKDSTAPIAQHAAAGYGAWLEDSFFAAYVISAEDDALISDPDETARKVAWGSRAHDSDTAMSLRRGGETAVWKGLMLGHDVDADADTYGDALKGNASITARLGGAALANLDGSSEGRFSLLDVSLTNIINDAGDAVARVANGIHWTNLSLLGASRDDDAPVTFAKGSEIRGGFYGANGGEVVGQFDKHDIVGVFGAVEHETDAALTAGQ